MDSSSVSTSESKSFFLEETGAGGDGGVCGDGAGDEGRLGTCSGSTTGTSSGVETDVCSGTDSSNSGTGCDWDNIVGLLGFAGEICLDAGTRAVNVIVMIS